MARDHMFHSYVLILQAHKLIFKMGRYEEVMNHVSVANALGINASRLRGHARLDFEQLS